MEIRYSKAAAKVINRMDAFTKQRIKVGIEAIPQGDIKPLQGYADGRQRLRIGQYRIVFRYIIENDEKVLYIIDIGVRGDIYK